MWLGGPDYLEKIKKLLHPTLPPTASFKSGPEPRIPGSLSSRGQVAARLPDLKSTFLLEGTWQPEALSCRSIFRNKR